MTHTPPAYYYVPPVPARKKSWTTPTFLFFPSLLFVAWGLFGPLPMWGAFLLIMLNAAYVLPTFIAWITGSPKLGSVTVVNLFLGWSFIGWVVALAMAVAE